MDQPFSALLDAYRRLWPNRSLTSESLNEQESKSLLYEMIIQELRDEWTHPRVRQTPEVKFYYAMKRVSSADLPNDMKIALIQAYLTAMEQLQANHT
ncbi:MULTISPECIES: hypothetical protein [Geobacillus]|jgi:hypothetical protein|uniref:Uncharacterized protein n=2 Tax=Geobacillus thermodenitrificans TaxID=33940 RepID=A4IQ29_GEOTN|nr:MULTISPECIES: hypothetical protein [Geobacillus]ABO67433.1 Conserved hypothetical protein [Geobacillus thermodenitrificans NG80-2]ARA99411.1 hypothetical protein GD3902_16010 [Geobacillus thermodenitrificans]ARP43183.1 hypothetical protein GTHT12_01657 [Geobacillus thermodenitrificans]ATO38719.1 hypothetical protein GTID1_16930 [Geobacillus thermodenitrificans]KQB92883.1 hypothetical protein GEPA3_2127 [Geobacillus sp. PA-3]